MSGEIEIKPHIRRNFEQILQAAKWSLSKKLTIPALVLLYSAIDIAAGLASDNPDINGKEHFVKWVNRYIAPRIRLSCSALDLYGARCGLVHTFGAESTLRKKGRAKQIHYAYGESDPAKLRKLAALAQIDFCVVVHTDDLFEAVREGVEAFLDAAATDSTLVERVNRNALFAFENLSEAGADELLQWGRERLNEGS